MNTTKPQGYVLMVVAVALVVIATSSLALFANTNQNNQQLNTRYQVQQLDYALDAAIEHTKAQLYNTTSCVGYTGVNGSLPNASYVSSLNANSGSPIKATVIATHVSGLQKSASIELNAYQAPVALNLKATEDTHVKEDREDENKGGDKKMHSQAKGDGKEEHPLIMFDLTVIPQPSMVTQASLQMRLDQSDNNNDPDNIYRIGRSWLADEATWKHYQSGAWFFWSEAGGQHQHHIWGSFPDSSEGTQTADITDLVQLWHNGLPNYGLLLRSEFDTNNSHKHYFSSDENNASRKPQIDLEYRCECGSSC